MQLLHYTSLAFMALSCFESVGAIPAGKGVIQTSSKELVSSWKTTSVFRLWGTGKATHETIPEHHDSQEKQQQQEQQQHLEIVTSISPTSCHHKGPLRCSPTTPNPATTTSHKYIYTYKPNKASSRLLDFPASLTGSGHSKSGNEQYGHGLLPAGYDLQRVLAPVGLLVIMVWLGFVAVVLVALMDYMWVRWVRASNMYLANHEDRDVEAAAGVDPDAGTDPDIGAVIGLGIIDEETRPLMQEKMGIPEDEICEDRIL